MRKYLVSYYTEQNDVCNDCEKIINAEGIEEALRMFKFEVKLYKRITAVYEMPNMELFQESLKNHDVDVMIEEVRGILKELFYEKWMDLEEWQEMLAEMEETVPVRKMADELAVGITNGYSIEKQKDMIRSYFKNTKND